MAYKRCPNLRDILGSNTIESNRVKRQTSKQTTGWSKPCLARADTLCCKQVVDTQIFKSNITNRSYTIYHKLTCKSEYIIYIMKCIKYIYRTLRMPICYKAAAIGQSLIDGQEVHKVMLSSQIW